MTPLNIAIVVLLAGGVFFTLVSAVGVVRLPDIYARAHTARATATSVSPAPSVSVWLAV